MSKRELALDAVRRGMTIADAARHFGVWDSQMRRWCQIAGVINQPEFPWAATARALWDEGCNDRYIADVVGCSREQVYLWRSCSGLPVNRNYGDPDEWRLRRRAVELVAGGMTFKQAAHRLGMSIGTVAGAVHRAKLAGRFDPQPSHDSHMATADSTG